MFLFSTLHQGGGPSAYVGTPDFLKILLDIAAKSGKDASSIKRGLVSGYGMVAYGRGVSSSAAILERAE